MRRMRMARGFTLVELMIVVAIIGVLAALAIYGVRHYLTTSKTTEAKQGIGRICRDATAAYERENAASENVTEGQVGAEASHELCLTSANNSGAVPNVVPAGRKYQPQTGPNLDFDADTAYVGWKCLRFSMSQPIYYQYWYVANGMANKSTNPVNCSQSCYQAAAYGDLTGDGFTSEFSQVGLINTSTNELKKASSIYIANEYQ